MQNDSELVDVIETPWTPAARVACETPLAHTLRASIDETQARRIADLEEQNRTLRRLAEHWLNRANELNNALNHIRLTIERVG